MASHAIEFEGMQLYDPILYVLVFLLFFTVLLILRRRQSRDVVVVPSLRLFILAMASSIFICLCVSAVAGSH